jgi:hypothetical protein
MLLENNGCNTATLTRRRSYLSIYVDNGHPHLLFQTHFVYMEDALTAVPV